MEARPRPAMPPGRSPSAPPPRFSLGQREPWLLDQLPPWAPVHDNPAQVFKAQTTALAFLGTHL